MGSCNVNHSIDDVLVKLAYQKEYLPESLAKELYLLIQSSQSQLILNDVFHLLKKYDLVTPEEQKNRNKHLSDLIKKL
ncbi:group-specific protein [Gottfriedia solisilvae]|uniref:Group-specific protein n=1 Tax=Gottfriedia solisilvae TaxID=1516104 RepID=A0A8J3AS60_9BACI|nr:group-specific protein [Gottfriedia solisilvae]GGI17829.1 hypothetical protein GCM10007380_39890 [Gottfriedia solisilvae]